MKAYIYPGQGSQYVGMGKDLYDKSSLGKQLFDQANKILNFDISKLMFEGTEDDLRQTDVTQPAIFLHSVILAKIMGSNYKPDMTAGHSLGEFSALVAANALSFEDGLKLVLKRAKAMQKACEASPSTMAAIIGLKDEVVEKVCESLEQTVVPANYNCPGQLVISGSKKGIEEACEILLEKGARIALPLKVGGAFHSPFMEMARIDLEYAILDTEIMKPMCPIYQNVNARSTTDVEKIKQNLIAQLTAPVYWAQTIKNMIADGCNSFVEIGPGKALQGMLKRINRQMPTKGIDKMEDL